MAIFPWDAALGVFLAGTLRARPVSADDAAAAGYRRPPGGVLAPGVRAHRAVYDLHLGETRGSTSVETMRGRIVYDFSGNACQGYALKFRQVTEIGISGGGTNMSDLRSTTVEDDLGKSFRFTSQNFVNDKLDTAIDGQAEREAGGSVAVALDKPARGQVRAAGRRDVPDRPDEGDRRGGRGGQVGLRIADL